MSLVSALFTELSAVGSYSMSENKQLAKVILAIIDELSYYSL